MTDRGVAQRPSETALFAALRRAIAYKEYKNRIFGADYMAEYFLPAHYRFFLRFRRIREKVINNLNQHLPGLTEYMIARTIYFDRLFVDALKDKTQQIVLLGAGYDSRAYRFAELNTSTNVFELDAPPTQIRKMECLKKARVDIPQHVKVVPIDFIQESIDDALAGAGYNSQASTLFLWEGVSYYLDSRSVDRTLEIVSESLSDKCAIAFDYTVTISDQAMNEVYGVDKFVQSMNEHHPDEGLLFSIDEGDIESFLALRNLKLIEHLDNQGIERELLVDASGYMIGQITGNFRFVIAGKE